MTLLKTWGAILLALSWTIIYKFYPSASWIEENPWLVLPVMALGLVMLSINWGKKGGEG